MSLKNIFALACILTLAACTKDKDSTKTKSGMTNYKVENTYSKTGSLSNIYMQKTMQKNGSIVARAILAKPSEEDLQFKWTGRKGEETTELHAGVIKAGEKMVSYKPSGDFDFISVEIFGFKDDTKFGNIKTLTLNPNAKVVVKAKEQVQEVIQGETTETAKAEVENAEVEAEEVPKERMKIDPSKVRVQQ